MDNKVIQQKLNEMEEAKLNVEKEKEQLFIELKSVQKRLENERNRADTASQKINEKDLELMKCKDVINVANKQIKFLDHKLTVSKEKRAKLKECLKEYANIKGGSKEASKPVEKSGL